SGVEKRLFAYATPREGAELGSDELRGWARGKLPAYMVPSAVVVLDELPLSPNGKVDRRALPAPEATSREANVAPRTPAEQILARAWAEGLHLDRVSLHANFFELGGDSILSIQIVAKANRAGVRLSPRQIFRHQTIASLAAAAEAAAAPEAEAEADVPIGAVPMTPVQRWFLDLHSDADPHHFNQAVLLELQADVPTDRLARAIAALERHHDALRMRFVRSDAGWEQSCPESGPPTSLHLLDLRGLDPEASRAAIEAAALEAQESLDLGPLWRVVRFDRGPARPLLLAVVHHLVVDAVSWRVLLEDLQSACGQLAEGGPLSLPPKTTSFRRWAQRLAEHAGKGGADGE